MHAYSVVVTRFMRRSLHAEICVDGAPRNRLVGVELFRTTPVLAEELTGDVRAVLRKRLRSESRRLRLRAADILWPLERPGIAPGVARQGDPVDRDA